jgi:beta-lactamase superfamily II metal-dependent hydrolase
VKDRLDALGIPAYRTDQLGAVIAEFAGDGLRVRAYEPPSLWTQWTGLP